MNYIQEHKQGLIGTVITHGLILFFLMYFGIITTVPKPPDEGILVNFGDSETGFGIEEPAPGEKDPGLKPIESASEKIAVPPPSKKTVDVADDDEVATQDIEKSVAVKTKKDKKPVEKVDPEKLRLAELERQQKAEELRKKQEEQRLLAEAAAEQRKIGEINSRVKNVFGGGGKGSPDSKSTSQGVTYGTGNQGVPQGSPNVDRYGPGGGTGNGISFSLDGRTSLSLPKPHYPGNEEGVVVVKVTVDKSGLVKNAEAGVRGSNTADPELISAAKKAALMAKFNVDANAPAFQVGTITYRFVLD
ncbi:MAG TPA: cell envelope integrity protein TolA [Prolixibacteraceae bacterium]|nr:cell envelope integrity protein TolA [Prolixibacteraceae bacterium]HPR85181.1 cell envelope integrity protein TolA [Prolixibacteraceae bacterium]